MTKRWAGLALVVTASLAACGGEDTLAPQVLPPDSDIAVEFRTDQPQYTIGASAKTTMVNRTTSTLSMGVCNDVLERAVDAGWVEIPPGNVACIALALVVPPGDSVTLSLDLRLASSPGTYRVRRHFSATTGGRTETMYRRTGSFAMVR